MYILIVGDIYEKDYYWNNKCCNRLHCYVINQNLKLFVKKFTK